MSTDRRAVSELSHLPPRTQVRVAGRVVHAEEGAFVLADATGNVRIAHPAPIALGALVELCGTWTGTNVAADALELHARPLADPFRPEAEHTRLLGRNRRIQHNLTQRARIMRLLRSAFDARGFLEVETPLAVPSPGLDLHLDAMGVTWNGPERYLITSPEYQMKRLLSGGLERIYQLGKCFRNDEVGARHQPEFTMLEWYRAYAGMAEVMVDTEEIVAEIATALHGRPVVLSSTQEIDVTPPWPRITLREAFEWFASTKLEDAAQDEDRFFRLLVECVEPALESVGAAFLCEYPASMASLARKKPGDPSVAERFEAYVGGIELCNGFGELTDPNEQRARLVHDQAARRVRGLPVYPVDERFLAALEEGMPPAGGNALGVDRLVMLLVGAEHIEDVLAIPASRL